MYMGRDKYENELLIKYGHPEDCWFHVDDLSSAHVYLRLHPGQASLEDIPPDALLDACSLVKANSIAGCKKSEVYVIYTKWRNLKKTADMVDGQVSYHRPQNVRRCKIEKNTAIVRQIEKTRTERPNPDLAKEQSIRLRQIQQEKKAQYKACAKAKEQEQLRRQQEKEERSYDRIMRDDLMTSNVQLRQRVAAATEDTTAAEEFEDDFM